VSTFPFPHPPERDPLVTLEPWLEQLANKHGSKTAFRLAPSWMRWFELLAPYLRDHAPLVAPASAAGGHPIWTEDFEPIEMTDGDGVTRLLGNWRWWQSLVTGTVGFGFYGSSGAGGHPGTVQIGTSNVGAGEECQIRPWFISAPAWFSAADPFDSYIIQWASDTGNNADEDFRVGFTGISGTTNPPTNGIYFEKLGSTDTNWFGVTRAGGLQTRVDTGVAWSNGFESWQVLRVRRIDASTIGFSVDGSTEVTQTLTIPTTWLDPWVALKNAAAGGQMSWGGDYWSIDFPTLDRGL
jgi:hypothetical protein